MQVQGLKERIKDQKTKIERCDDMLLNQEIDKETHQRIKVNNKLKSISPLELLKCVLAVKGIGNRILPIYHATLSGYNFVAQVFSDITHKSIVINFFVIFFSCMGGACSALISPKLRFRFSKIDSTRFEKDPLYSGAAYRTKQAIEPWRIGLLGSLLIGVNLAWFSRIKANPIKILTGIVQLTFAIAIFLGLNIFLTNPAFIFAGALIA